jgi:hypothetical protein
VGAMKEVDQEQRWGLLDGGAETNVRCVEFHHVEDGGALTDEGHKDTGSLITIDCMLSDPSSDFVGGRFYTPRINITNQCREASVQHEYHTFEQGDALVFTSHKYHVRSIIYYWLRASCAHSFI